MLIFVFLLIQQFVGEQEFNLLKNQYLTAFLEVMLVTGVISTWMYECFTKNSSFIFGWWCFYIPDDENFPEEYLRIIEFNGNGTNNSLDGFGFVYYNTSVSTIDDDDVSYMYKIIFSLTSVVI